jgi:hypothetical protein
MNQVQSFVTFTRQGYVQAPIPEDLKFSEFHLDCS